MNALAFPRQRVKLYAATEEFKSFRARSLDVVGQLFGFVYRLHAGDERVEFLRGKFEFEQSVAFKHDHSKSLYIVFFGFGHGCGGGRERHKARAYCGYCLFGFHIFVRMC